MKLTGKRRRRRRIGTAAHVVAVIIISTLIVVIIAVTVNTATAADSEAAAATTTTIVIDEEEDSAITSPITRTKATTTTSSFIIDGDDSNEVVCAYNIGIDDKDTTCNTCSSSSPSDDCSSSSISICIGDHHDDKQYVDKDDFGCDTSDNNVGLNGIVGEENANDANELSSFRIDDNITSAAATPTTILKPGTSLLDYLDESIIEIVQQQPDNNTTMTILKDIHTSLKQGKPVIVRNAFREEFAHSIFQHLYTYNNWTLMSADKRGIKTHYYQKHGMKPEHSDVVKELHNIFNHVQSRLFMSKLTGKNCMSKTKYHAFPSYYKNSDHSNPHTDRQKSRTITFLWQLTTPHLWKPEYGGHLYWNTAGGGSDIIGSGKYIVPTYNSLILFSVTPNSIHSVLPVVLLNETDIQIQEDVIPKRLTYGGWYSADFASETYQPYDNNYKRKRKRDKEENAKMKKMKKKTKEKEKEKKVVNTVDDQTDTIATGAVTDTTLTDTATTEASATVSRNRKGMYDITQDYIEEWYSTAESRLELTVDEGKAILSIDLDELEDNDDDDSNTISTISTSRKAKILELQDSVFKECFHQNIKESTIYER